MSSYWSKRQNQLYKSMEKDESALKERLSSFYESEYSSLDKEIAAYYQKYGTNNVIEYRTLMKTLSAEDVKLLIEKTDEFTLKYPQYAHLVPVRNSIYKLNRLEGLQYSVVMQQLKIGAVDIDKITKHLDKQSLKGLNAAMETLGFGKNFYSEGADIIKQFVDVEWSDGLNFSSRIWKNTEKLANYLNTDIAQGFARGDSYEKLTARLRKRFEDVSKNDAYRLIYTEGTFVMAESTMQPFVEDFEKYKVSTAGDGKVCSICSGIARNEYYIKDRKAGVNFPPFHSWCRCTFEIVVDDWDKWLDDYEKKHGGNGEKISERLRRGANGNDIKEGKFKHEIIGKANSEQECQRFINAFINEYKTAEIEHLLVIDRNGNVHHITSGFKDSVFYENLDEVFKDSYNIHNHPPKETQFTFSVDADIPAMFADGTKIMEAFDYKYRYRFERPEGISFEEWDKVRNDVEDDLYRIMNDNGYELNDYAEFSKHLLITETFRRLKIKGYKRWEI